MIHSICYFSTAKNSLSEIELKSLLSFSKDENIKKNITGILVYADGNFMQVLEGVEITINSLYKKISTDHRHRNIIKVSEINYQDRIFEEYDCGFTIIDNKASIEELNTYLSWISNHPSKEINKFVNLLEQFIKNI